MTALVLTGNQIAEREDEVAQLEAEDAAAEAQGRSASSPTPSSATCANSAWLTISSLADSRFDWERVMRELALILPDDVWLDGPRRDGLPGRRRRRSAAARAVGAARLDRPAPLSK